MTTKHIVRVNNKKHKTSWNGKANHCVTQSILENPMVLELSLSIRGIPMVLDITLSPATDFLASLCYYWSLCPQWSNECRSTRNHQGGNKKSLLKRLQCVNMLRAQMVFNVCLMLIEEGAEGPIGLFPGSFVCPPQSSLPPSEEMSARSQRCCGDSRAPVTSLAYRNVIIITRDGHDRAPFEDRRQFKWGNGTRKGRPRVGPTPAVQGSCSFMHSGVNGCLSNLKAALDCPPRRD